MSAAAPVAAPPTGSHRAAGQAADPRHVAPVQGTRRAWPMLDVVLVAAIAALPATGAAVWGVAVAAAGVIGVGTTLLRAGSSPAHRLLGLRTVDPATGVPPTLGRLLTGRALTADLRAGRDPLAIVAGPHVAPVPFDPGSAWAPGGSRARTTLLVTDDGQRIDVSAPVVLGRRPADPSGAWTPVALTDLSRTLSRNHVAVAPHPDGLEVTDLGSANGTAVALPGTGQQVLTPRVAVVVPVGSRLAVGDRVLVVTDAAGAP
ncbi:FHA domain-containing protein [Cellulomonas dongxiuzhuiae]|uniref:FHA domain-containing protein n=1 Tax=Cellulomonas dongxiuzhuiae TaxID=2819979 RepID=UPI001AAEB372|nr:FHA domain-containing protein [Cellulomonas dongxiuzhuiae]MBO3089843.1 FHA domain-containing protein [Cellulomonas dongxiuzhuiae]